MPRPTTKSELSKAANEQFQKMWKLIDSLSEDEQNAIFDFGDISDKKEAHWARDRNLRDVLTHLYEWHQLLLAWVAANQSGETKPFLPEPYTWKTYGTMNTELFWKKHQNTPYEKSQQMIRESHTRVLELIDDFTDEELFAKGVFKWTGGTTLGSYCISTTASHYDWAIKKIKAHIKAISSVRESADITASSASAFANRPGANWPQDVVQ